MFKTVRKAVTEMLFSWFRLVGFPVLFFSPSHGLILYLLMVHKEWQASLAAAFSLSCPNELAEPLKIELETFINMS